ncbi:MAG: uncharacterized metal-binding protein YceD (DUF177 family) [Planctomycetota bacterium]|jgi:uncharacterized metal-binding protein YceD (DUF177 family)
MNFFCKLFGHTWVHQTENVKVSWNTNKKMNELDITTEVEPRFWLQCQRCAERNESPSREEIRSANN